MPIPLTSRIKRLIQRSLVNVQPAITRVNQPLTDMYKLLTLYYLSNGLYDDVSLAASDTTQAGKPQPIRALRNPTFRAVEFYASKLWPGALPHALPIIAPQPDIVQPIHQLWTWSNWATRKQRAARWLALYGDLYIKVVDREVVNPRPDEAPWRIFFDMIKPWHMTSCSLNERGHIIEARIDIPRYVTEEGRTVLHMYTEHWTRDRFRNWDRKLMTALPIIEPFDKMGFPNINRTNDLGFVPIVYASFRDMGDITDEGDSGGRGFGVINPAIEKIDEANRMATTMHRRLFRYGGALLALESGMMDNSGRPIPAPRLTGSSSSALSALGLDDTDSDPFIVSLAGEEVVRLPGMSKLTSLVPPLDYAAMLNILQAQLLEIERDIPELRYYRMDELGQVSGVAVRAMLSDAVDHVIESRGNAEAALVRLDQIGLTLGQLRDVPGFEATTIGTYQAGDFEHSFAEREVFPKTSLEFAQEVQAWTQAGLPLGSALRKAGMSEDEINQALRERDQEAQAALQRQQVLMSARTPQQPESSQPPATLSS